MVAAPKCRRALPGVRQRWIHRIDRTAGIRDRWRSHRIRIRPRIRDRWLRFRAGFRRWYRVGVGNRTGHRWFRIWVGAGHRGGAGRWWFRIRVGAGQRLRTGDRLGSRPPRNRLRRRTGYRLRFRPRFRLRLRPGHRFRPGFRRDRIRDRCRWHRVRNRRRRDRARIRWHGTSHAHTSSAQRYPSDCG